MLKHTGEARPGFEIELLTDVDMYKFFAGVSQDHHIIDTSTNQLVMEKRKPKLDFREYGMGRSRVSYVGTRTAKANNPYLSDYNPEDPTSFIAYYDANNLYSVAQSFPIPYRNFVWMDEERLAKPLSRATPGSSWRCSSESI